MAASTVPAAKAALKALLIAHTWPGDDPTVKWGQPTEGEDFPRPTADGVQLIYFRNTNVVDDLLTLGHTRNDEHYALTVVIDVRRYGDDEQTTEERAWLLAGEILTVTRANHTLSDTINRIEGYRKRDESVPTDQGWLVRLVLEIDCVGLVF